MTTMRIPCPHCARPNDQHTGVDGDNPPVPGDISLCFGCCRLATYTSGPFGLTLTALTADEQARIERHRPEIIDLRAAVLRARLRS